MQVAYAGLQPADAAGRRSLRTAVELVADRSRIGSIVEPPLAEQAAADREYIGIEQ